MSTKSVGNCRVEQIGDFYFVIDDIDRSLAQTRYLGIANILRDLYNSRGSEMDLITGEWLTDDKPANYTPT